jgi:hypothetical protein
MMVAMSDLYKFASAAGFGSLDVQQVFQAYKNAIIYMKDKEIDKLCDMSQAAMMAAQSALSQFMMTPF